MSNGDTHPTTLVGIKRLAKTLKKSEKLPHFQALDGAAQRAGFENFRHARNSVHVNATASPDKPFRVFLSAYWQDDNGGSGRETLQAHVSRPLRELVDRGRNAGPYRLDLFRTDADDHLETREDLVSQDVARMVVAEAARALHFMDATDLCSRTAKWSYRLPEMPRQDHSHHWIHRPTGAEVVADEPYFGEWLLGERQEWGSNLGVKIAMASVRLYGDGLDLEPMFFASFNQEALNAICAGIERSKSDLLQSRTWTGESAPYAPVFVSPARQLQGRRKRPRPKPIDFSKPRNNALPYIYAPLCSDICWRPANAMPREAHEEIGRLTNALVDLDGRSCFSPISRVRARLDSWLGCELNSATVLGASTTRVYWRANKARLPEGISASDALDRIAELLKTHYLDSAPLRMPSPTRSMQ